MSGPLLLALRHLQHRRGTSLLLVACLALTGVLPIAVQLLVGAFSTRLRARALATPLVVGAPGSRFDLVLNTLYFRGRVPRPLPMRELDALIGSGLGTPIPILARDTAQGLPLVGTTPDYFAFRGLRFAAGGMPLAVGECAVGAEAAARLQLTVGSRVISDPGSLYAIEAGYPLRMRVVGVLAPAGSVSSPDDLAVFASLQTVWIAEGLGHGHAPPAEQASTAVLRADGENVVLDSSVFIYQEITEQNAASFHFHEDPAELPLTGVIVMPRDTQSATILKGRYRVADDAQMLVPADVVDEITGFVLRLKTFFDANSALVAVATAALLGLVIALSIRVRQRELQTLERLGVSRGAVARSIAWEYGIVCGLGALAALALGLALSRAVAVWWTWI
ncbi:MAG: ABC transporter permease [Planctomycetes bacterium]|nr:ABC transporter permease [Planctomycetota bacterium]